MYFIQVEDTREIESFLNQVVTLHIIACSLKRELIFTEISRLCLRSVAHSLPDRRSPGFRGLSLLGRAAAAGAAGGALHG